MAKDFIVNDETPDSVLFDPTKGRGLNLEDRPRGYAYGAVAEPFPAELLIPESEWQARIKEMEQTKTRITDLCDLRGLKVKDQARTNFCVTEDTEVLTDRGWVEYPKYNGSDLLATINPLSGRMEFQAPTANHVFEHDGPMVYSTNGSVDFGVTPDHRMLVRKWDEAKRTLSKEWTFQRAGDLGWYFGLPHAPTGFVGTQFDKVTIEGDRDYNGWDFIALIALVVSDGYAGGTEKTKNWVSFACFRGDRLPKVRELAVRIGFREKATTPGVFIRYDAGALAEWFRKNAYTSPDLGAQNKRVPEFIKSSSELQIRHFLACYGDQNHDRGNHYFSTSKRAIDDLQELFFRVGKRGSIWQEERDGKSGTLSEADGGKVITSRKRMYHLHVRQVDRLSMDRKQHLATEHYKGQVYCATVPNSTLVTRRNGSILISGNCWFNAPTHCLEIDRVMQNESPVSLSPASGACKITNFRNVGGWGKQALEFIIDTGVVPSSMWPDTAIDRQYDTAATNAERGKYRVVEWWELEPRNLDQLMSVLLRRWPVAVGYNWWSHEVTAVNPRWIDGAPALDIDNSWGTSWGTNGRGVLQGNRMLPDDAVVPRTALAS